MQIVSGIDFGTSNSTVSYIGDGDARMVDFEKDVTTMPTALFFHTEENGVKKILYGNDAIGAFLRKEDGRFMKSIKSILGTSLMGGDTRINNRLVNFDTIIGYFIAHLKSKLDSAARSNIESVVMGRPVKFNEIDGKLDSQAQDMLKQIAINSGFKFVEFQYEPIAAAFAHERDIKGEKLAIVVDIGGGTSDFSVIKLGDKLKDKTDRHDDILANTGVKAGGDIFDKNLSFNKFMPVLGKNAVLGDKKLPMPAHIFFELSDWSSINFIYAPKTTKMIREIYSEADDKTKVGRLVELVVSQRAHELLRLAEQTKIALTSRDTVKTVLNPVKDKPEVITNCAEFDGYSKNIYDKIQSSLDECLSQAGKQGSDIGLVVLTGGSTEIIKIKNMVRAAFPNAEISDKNKMSSVGKGLAYDARRRFSR
jgi:hypothetical chaperone protein